MQLHNRKALNNIAAYGRFRSSTILAAAALSVTLSSPSLAAYPERPVTLVVSAIAGSPLDILGRMLATEAGKDLSQTVIVENKPGASGTIGAQYVSRAKPDGYTLLLTLDTTATVNPSIYKKSQFNANESLTPVARLGSFDQVLVAPQHIEVSTLKDFASTSKSRSFNYASAGVGSPGHLTMEAFKLSSALPLNHIPYQGSPAALNDLIGGRVDTGFLVVAAVLPQIKAGKLQPLAVSGAERNPNLPEVPTLKESGIPGLEHFDATFSYLVYAPKDTPQPIVDQWNGILQNVLRRPEAAKTLNTLDIRPTFETPAASREWIASATAKWAEVIKAANISITQ